MKYEIVQEHQYQDIYRVCHGVLLIVNKYKNKETDWDWYLTNKNKTKLKKINGLKDCFELKEDIEVYSYDTQTEVTIPKGSIIFHGNVIESLTDKKDFYYELKTTGSCFGGSFDKFNELMATVKEIMNKY